MKQETFADRLKADIPASIVVFLVATPLCLGIALASGAPLFSGLIAGIVGGLVVGAVSGSALGVAGPAAGLAVIVLNAITTLGAWETFLLAVVLAGVIQVALGFAQAGVIAYYFPSSVIKGMLTGIGLTIILKQLPHAIGYDASPEGSLAFSTPGGDNTFSALWHMFGLIQPGALTVALVSLAVLLLWERPFIKQHRASLWIQGPLVAVVLAILLNGVFTIALPAFAISASHLVQVPIPDGFAGLVNLLTVPDFRQLANPAVYTTALTLAVVASLETLLCVEATDRMDPLRRVTPTDRELKAQGLGNIVSGLLGGLPLTQVIVRSSANIQSGARSKLSAILHGGWLLIAVLAIPTVLNRIPLAVLATILILVGYKLAKPALFAAMYRLGWYQFAPFMVTVVAILLTDLLIGIGLGLVTAVFFILLNNYRNPYFVDVDPGPAVRFVLSEDVSFLNRAAVMRALDAIPPGSKVEIDATRSMSIDYDVYELLKEFEQRAKNQDIDLTIRGLSDLRRENDAMRRVEHVLGQSRPRAVSQPA
jgi:MFS superfamily sulfate permease-like transporter